MQRLSACLMMSGVLACQDAPTDESPLPAISSSRVSPVLAANRPQQVHGRAIAIHTGGSGFTEYSSFNAIRHKDGTFGGHFRVFEDFVTTQPSLRFHGNVTCFEVVGSVAYLEGVATGNTPDIPAGTPIGWSVRDNGKGGSSPPDMISSFLTFAGNCESHFLEPTFNSEKGDIRVEP